MQEKTILQVMKKDQFIYPAFQVKQRPAFISV